MSLPRAELPNTLGEALSLAKGRIERIDARVLLREAAGVSATTLAAYPERALATGAASLFVDWLERRERGEPVAYLTGEREFFGRVFRVSPATLIPRPETELLVELALASVENTPGPRLLDLGTGSGVIAISIALERPDAVVTAVDFSPAAIDIAAGNALAQGAKVNCLLGSWFQPVADERFHCIVSNPPYIAEHDPHLGQGDLRFEPVSALASGPSGLNDIRLIVENAHKHLVSGGSLLLEHGYDQAEAVRALLLQHGFADVSSWQDIAGIERVSGGRMRHEIAPPYLG